MDKAANTYEVPEVVYANREILKEQLPCATGFQQGCINMVQACPETAPALKTTGAPMGWKRKTKKGKQLLPIVFSKPWPKASNCNRSPRFLVPPAGLPVSLDCEMARFTPYTGQEPKKNGDGAVWSGKSIALAVSVSVYDLYGRDLFSSILQPPMTPSDWQSAYSGVTMSMVTRGRPVYYDDARAILAQILANRPVYGSSIATDFEALLMDPPSGCELREMQSDWSVIQMLAKKGFTNRRLETMYKAATGEDLRVEGQPHSAAADARKF